MKSYIQESVIRALLERTRRRRAREAAMKDTHDDERTNASSNSVAHVKTSQAVVRMLALMTNALAREALIRAAASSSGGRVTVDDLKKILPQLLLDFAS